MSVNIGWGTRLVASAIAGIGLLALATLALADDNTAAQSCRALRHGTEEFAACLYRDGAVFDYLPSLELDEAQVTLNEFVADPGDAACIRETADLQTFVLCYFRRDIFEADGSNPAWGTLGPELEIGDAPLYTPSDLTPLESSEPTPQAAPEATPFATPADPELSPAPTSEPSPTPEPTLAPTAVAPDPAPQPSDLMPVPPVDLAPTH